MPDPDFIFETILDLPETETPDAGDYVELAGPGGPRRIAAQNLGGGGSFAPVLVNVPIPPGALTVPVAFPAPLAAPPNRILCSITKPVAGDNLWASPVAGSITTDGFTAELSGLPDMAGFTLVCLILP
jgi:hypothetical protein